MHEEQKRVLVSIYPVLEYFKYAHLPPRLQEHSKPFCDLAFACANTTIPGYHPEVAECLRKLVEAKDCFVRSQVKK